MKQSLTGLALLLATLTISCGIRPKQTMLPEGQEMMVRPIRNVESETATVRRKIPNIGLHIEFKGAVLSSKSDFSIELYRKLDDPSPNYSFNIAELIAAKSKTNCTADIVDAFERNWQGDYLFCNGSLDLGGINRFVLKNQGEIVSSATHINIDGMQDGVQLASLSFL